MLADNKHLPEYGTWLEEDQPKSAKGDLQTSRSFVTISIIDFQTHLTLLSEESHGEVAEWSKAPVC